MELLMRLLALLLLVASLSTQADVLVCMNPTACTTTTTKPKISLTAADLVQWCSSGDVTQGSSTGCTSKQWITYNQMQPYSWAMTDTGWYRVSDVPTVAATTTPSTTFTAVKPNCWFAPIGSGTLPKFDTLSPRGGNVATEPALITWGCSDGYVYSRVTYSGILSARAAEFASAYAKAAFSRDTSGLDALSLKVTRPLTDAEQVFSMQLFQESNPPPLWVVAKASSTTRPAYNLDAGALGSKVGTVSILGSDGKPQACNCGLRYQNSTSTYCGVGGLDNIGTTSKLPNNAVTICAKP